MAPTRPTLTAVRAVLHRHPDGDPDPGSGDPPEPTGDDPANDPGLGDAGKRALDQERRARRAAEQQAKEQAAQLDALQKQIDELNRQNQSEEERRIADAVAAATADVTATFEQQLAAKERQLLTSRLSAAAAGKLTNPADALAFISLDDLDRDGEGNVTDETLSGAVEKLREERPYLAATAGKGGGSADQGRRSDAPPDLKDRKQLANQLSQFGLTPRG
jgi:hypothetical protein